MTQKKRITAKEFEHFNEQLSMLLQKGYPLVDGLEKFAHEVGRSSFEQAVKSIADKLRGGSSLTEAMEGVDGLSPEYMGMLKAGEAAGKIGEALNIALEHDLERMEMEQKLKGVIYYPLLIIGWSGLVFLLVVSKIFPVFAKLYADFGGVLPWTFMIVTNVYSSLFHYWYIVVVLLAGLWYLTRRLGIVGIAMSIPGLSSPVTGIMMARLARGLGMMLKGGVPIDQALVLISDATSNPVLKNRLNAAANRVKNGESLSAALVSSKLGAGSLSDLAALGEDAGTLPDVLIDGAEVYKIESTARLEVVMQVAGLCSILAAGLWVLLISSSLISTYALIPTLAL